jgi:pre-mRNA 3'-end-processing factor FIP1
MDADLADATKPWRLPGSDQSDYFNYGFDEFTWEMYRQRQAGMAANLNAQKAETAQFQQMFMPGMSAPGPNPAAGAGGVPNAPSGPSGGGGGMRGGAGDAGMGGMPDLNEEQMMQMMSQMQASGMNPQNMDFNTFMQMAGGMGMGGPGPGFGNQPQGNHGGGGGARGGGGRRGRGGW